MALFLKVIQDVTQDRLNINTPISRPTFSKSLKNIIFNMVVLPRSFLSVSYPLSDVIQRFMTAV